jgi:hypothetical protein
METGYKDKSEVTREFYRKQGEIRKKQQILNALAELRNNNPSAAWSPTYLIELIERL